MKIESMKQLCVEQLKDLYHAEQQLDKAIPRLAKAARAPQLRETLEKHHGETGRQLERLREVFKSFGEEPQARKCRAMEGLIAEADDLLADEMEPELRDAAIIAAAQRVEHYEMAGYGAARTYAEMLGEKDAARRLQDTLDEEGRANESLKQLALERVNREALSV